MPVPSSFSGHRMDRLVDDFIRATSDLKVHKRTAANIREQLLIISRSQGLRDSKSRSLLCSSSKTPLQELQTLSRLLPLQSYLRQGEVSDLLDSLLEACWNYAQTSNDVFLREDIDTQREIYKSDHDADRVNLKRLLRDCVRQTNVQQLLSNMTAHEISVLHSAINLELRSISDQGPDSQTVRLFKEFLSRLEIEPMQGRKSREIQDLTGKIVRISKYPIAWGAVCAVWKGELYGKSVTLHSPSPPVTYRPENDEINVLKNSIEWASFDHPHVLPLLGICREFDKRGIALVSPWMENQTAENFMRTNPGADRLKLITEIASGLVYLHSRSPPYVHGLLTASGVLVNEEKQAVVGGFASATFEKGWMTPLRWLAPENIKRTTYSLTTASDTYSFAMTALQIMTGAIPFEGVESPASVIDLLERGERPARPDRKLVHHGLDDRLWSLMSRCWVQDPKARPPMTEVLRELKKMRELPALNVRDLTSFITLGNGGVGDIRDCGAFGDIRIGILKDAGPVALKTLNIKGKTQPVLRHTKRFLREASIWNDLKHPNVLPFLGTADPPGLSTCLVSPWMENGNLIEYMKRHPGESSLHIVEYLLWKARGIARGLSYLHAHKPNAVIHGDLRGANVLISNSGEPLLCDFGLAVIIEDLAQMPISSLLQDAGNPRWMAPELFVGEQQVSTASDVWALGMVLLEITSLDMPYCELKNSAQVIVEVHKGSLPSRPLGEDAVRRGLSDELWALMMRCWAQKAVDRPLAVDVLNVIESFANAE